MDKQKDEKHLDELISRAINTKEPQFDAEKWQQQYPDEYQMLISRREKAASSRQPNIWRIIFGKPVPQIAAAAVVIAATGLFVTQQNSRKQKLPGIANVATTPVEMMTEMSLMGAYRRGGIEAVDKQCEQAFQKVGLHSASVSIEQILAEFNGNSPERTRL